MRIPLFATLVLLPLTAFAQSRPNVAAGTVSSAAPISIDGTMTPPGAAPAWPIAVDSELAATSAPALLSTPEGNRLIFERGSTSKIGSIQIAPRENGRTFVFLRGGGVAFETRARLVYICAAGRLFVPPTPSSGYVRLDKPGTPLRHLDNGTFVEDGRRACNEQGLAPGELSALPDASGNPAAGGIASATPPTVGAGIGPFQIGAIAAGGVTAALAAITSYLSSANFTPTTFTPPAVSPSAP